MAANLVLNVSVVCLAELYIFNPYRLCISFIIILDRFKSSTPSSCILAFARVHYTVLPVYACWNVLFSGTIPAGQATDRLADETDSGPRTPRLWCSADVDDAAAPAAALVLVVPGGHDHRGRISGGLRDRRHHDHGKHLYLYNGNHPYHCRAASRAAAVGGDPFSIVFSLLRR